MPGFNDGFLGVPARPGKPRSEGLTHVLDKGLNIRDIEGLFDTAGEFVDIVKLGWGTGYVTNNLEKKIALYRSFATPVVCGGTLFEAVYARDKNGEPITNGAKRGVPLGDVWNIPYLNPKAKERVGYPTQKPLVLMERIIELSTDPHDFVVDPFCGSGTTLVAAKLLGRHGLGVDISAEAVRLTEQRLAAPVKTESQLMDLGREHYIRNDLEVLEYLKGVPHHVVQRNKGIDAILVDEWRGKPVCLKIQRHDETILDSARALARAAKGKGGSKLILVAVNNCWGLLGDEDLPPGIALVLSTTAAIENILRDKMEDQVLPRTVSDNR